VLWSREGDTELRMERVNAFSQTISAGRNGLVSSLLLWSSEGEISSAPIEDEHTSGFFSQAFADVRSEKLNQTSGIFQFISS